MSLYALQRRRQVKTFSKHVKMSVKDVTVRPAKKNISIDSIDYGRSLSKLKWAQKLSLNTVLIIFKQKWNFS